LRGRDRWTLGIAVSMGVAAPSLVVVSKAWGLGDVAQEIPDAGPYRPAPPMPRGAPLSPLSGAPNPEARDGETVAPGRADAAPATAAPQGDIVESIEPEGVDAGPSPPARQGAVGSRVRTDFTGWARESLEWPLAATGFRVAAPSPYDVPHDRVISRTQLFVRASHVRDRWFEATVSGVLGYSFREQGPSGTDTFDGINGQATNADPQAELRELYIGLFSSRVDVRIGQQRVAWGRADLQSPNDVLNARDLRDPILTEPELRHVPTPLLRVDFDVGAVSVQLVGTPVFVPDVYDVYGTNWAAIQEDAPQQIRGLFGSVSPLFDPTKQAAFNSLIRDTQLPSSNWAAPSGGVKLSTSLGGLDVDLYYHYGFDGTPNVSVSPSFAAFLMGENFQGFRPSDLTPVLQALDMGEQPFSATYVRRHHVGLDAATVAGPIAFRLDVAYDTERVYYLIGNLTSLVSPSFAGVASIEYQTGDIDKVVLLEANYNRIVDTIGQPLLGYDQDSFGLAGTFRWPFGGGWAVDLRGLVGVEPVSLMIEPALRWKINEAVAVRAGTVLLAGETDSVGWYYRDNTSVFLQGRYSF
jgi:hypothetical protein